ncbi:MAG TPA: hypothetical protein DCZ23_00740 [Lachnospiraceae bacterium]|nr:hypothetical protein [Lachnospiraceae bacterium]
MNVIIEVYMKLVKNLSKIKGFNGWMIAKAEFKTAQLNNCTAVVQTEKTETLRQRSNYSAIASKAVHNGIEYMLIMHIARPCRDSLAENTAASISIKGDYLFTLKYTNKDIKQFIKDSGDSNYIHQTNTPVVPGFLIFRDIINKLSLEKMHESCVNTGQINCIMYFKTPAFADESIDLFKTDNSRFELILSKRKAMYGKGIYNRRS